jgi:hypothetical protein
VTVVTVGTNDTADHTGDLIVTFIDTSFVATPLPPGTLALDPVSASSSITVNNLTASSRSATPSGVRATAPVDVSKNAKIYFEVAVDVPTEHWACGMCGELFNLTSATGLGTTGNIIVSNVVADSFGFFPYSDYEPARVYVNQHQQGASYLVSAGGQNAVAGDVVRIVYDTVNATFWVSSPSMVKDGNVWNNAPLSISDPGAGTGGFVCIAGNDLYPAFWTSDSGSQATFNFGDSAFANAIPTGCVAYNQAALSNPTPSYASVPAPAGLGGGAATNTTIQLAWQAPSGGPYTYRVQRLVISVADNITKLGQIAWTDVGTTSSTSLVATVPSLANTLLNFPFRVQAINGSGTHGLWSQPGPADAAGNGSQSTFLVTPFVSQVGQTTSSVTIALAPQVNTASFPAGVTITYSVSYLPLFGNMDRSPQVVPIPYPAPAPWVLVNDSVSSTNRTTLTISGLSSGTQYVVYVFVKDSALSTPPVATYIWAATAPSSGAALKLLDRNGWLVPSGAIFVDYNTDYHVFMPVGSTAHFAVYYDVNAYNNATLANAVIAQVESVYSFCLTSFGATASLHTACIESPINTDGSKMNIFLTGPGYGGEHLSCANADIFVGSVAADRGFLDTAMLIVVAEVTEVFMPQLQSLPDCDQHPVGEALSIAMAFSLWPNGILVGQTTANLAAYYLNTKTDADGTADPAAGVVRRDWVNSNPAGETVKQFPAIGCAALFMGYLHSQLGFSFAQICSALDQLSAFSTCRALYNKLANNTTDPFPAFIALLNAHFPATSQVNSLHFTQNPFPLT